MSQFKNSSSDEYDAKETYSIELNKDWLRYNRDHNLNAIFKINADNFDFFSESFGAEFSKFKYGDPESISLFAGLIASEILEKLGPEIIASPDHWRIVYPARKAIPTAATLLADHVNYILLKKYKIDLNKIYLKRRRVFNGDFGEIKSQNTRESQIFDNFFYDGDDLNGKKTIFIEDALVSGTHYRETQRVLELSGVNLTHIHGFFIADIESKTFVKEGYSVENKINHIWVKSPYEMIEILQKSDVVVTARMIKFIFKFETDKFKEILDKIDLYQLAELYSAALDENLNEDPRFLEHLTILSDALVDKISASRGNLNSIYQINSLNLTEFISKKYLFHPFFENKISLGSMYSLLKYGDLYALDFFADQLSKKIKEEHLEHIERAPRRWSIARVGYSTLPGAAQRLAERVAERLDLSLASITREDIPATSYGELNSLRARAAITQGAFKLQDPINENVIIIEDAVVSGTVLRALIKSISDDHKKIYPYSIVDLRVSDFKLEQNLNSAMINHENIAILSKIMNTDNMVIVARTIKTILSLNDQKIEELFDNVKGTEHFINIFNIARINRLDLDVLFKHGFQRLSSLLNQRIRSLKELDLPPYEPMYIITQGNLKSLQGLIQGYSRLKYGDAEATARQAARIAAVIQARVGAALTPARWVIAATHYYRVANAAQILARGVAARLGLPMADIRRKQIYEGEFGALASTQARQAIITHNAYCSAPAQVHAKHVIYIDDAFVSGVHLQEHYQMLLDAGALSVTPFSIFDVADGDLTIEKDLNYASIEQNDSKRVIEILASPENALITRSIKLLLKQPPQTLLADLDQLDDERVFEITEAAEAELYSDQPVFEASYRALRDEARARHLRRMGAARGLARVPYRMMLLDYDDTLAAALTPLSAAHARLLVRFLARGVEVAIISLQPIGARGLSEFAFEPILREIKARQLDPALLSRLHLLPSEGISLYQADAQGHLDEAAPHSHLGLDQATWARFKRIVVDEVAEGRATRVYLRGGYISLHFKDEASLLEVQAALRARLTGFKPPITVQIKPTYDPDKWVLHARLAGASKAIGRAYMLGVIRARLAAEGRVVPREAILVAGDRMGEGESDAAMFVYGGVNLALGSAACPGAYDHHRDQGPDGLFALLSAVDEAQAALDEALG
ncbi:phosphoribosyltransferase family protein [Myxococcota bacterium]|nr:phosphoribosyltransferase family protein [Myxococcota bacterium]